MRNVPIIFLKKTISLVDFIHLYYQAAGGVIDLLFLSVHFFPVETF